MCRKDILIVLLAICSICSCSSIDKQAYYLKKGEECKEHLLSELEEVQSLRDLFEKQERLTLLFDKIARLCIEARTYQLETKTSWSISPESEITNTELKKQLLRVLKIPGARAFLEKCQIRSFEKIYTFELRNSR
jgi:hypothetical protein